MASTTTFENLQLVTYKSLAILYNQLVIASVINREFDDSFAVDGAKTDAIARVRNPVQYEATTREDSDDWTLPDHPYTETTIPVKVNIHSGIKLRFLLEDITLSLDNTNDRIIEPQISELATKVDMKTGERLVPATPYYVGSPTSRITDSMPFYQAQEMLDWNSVPRMGRDRLLVVNPSHQTMVLKALEGLYNAQSEISKQYMQAEMGGALGWKWMMSQQLPIHTVGTFSDVGVVDGADQTETSIQNTQTLSTDGWAPGGTANLKAGDVLTIAGVNQLQPKTRWDIQQLQPFVVLEDVSAAGGDMDIKVWPQIIIDGSYRTVSNAPADNAQIFVWDGKDGTGGPDDTYSGAQFLQSLCLHRDFGNLASVELVPPAGNVDHGRASDDQIGLAIQLVSGFDVDAYKNIYRADMMYGVNPLRRSFACRVIASR